MLQMDQMTQLPYCVYAHFVDDHLIYIGSGETCRAFTIGNRKPHHLEMMSHGNVKVALLGRYSSRDEALRVERIMLRGFKPPANINVGPSEPVYRPKRANRKREVLKKDRLKPEARAVLTAMTVAAIANEPCPTNGDIAAITGSRPEKIQRILGRLAGKGLLRVEIGSNYRIVHVGEHSTKPTKDFNSQNVATVRHERRKVDWIVV